MSRRDSVDRLLRLYIDDGEGGERRKAKAAREAAPIGELTDELATMLRRYLDVDAQPPPPRPGSPSRPRFRVPRAASVDGLLRRQVLDGADVAMELAEALRGHLMSEAKEADVRDENEPSWLDGLSTQAIPPQGINETGPLPRIDSAEERSLRRPAHGSLSRARRLQPRARVGTGRGSEVGDSERIEIDRLQRAAAETADSPWVEAAAADVGAASNLGKQLLTYAEHYAAEDEATHAYVADHESTLRGVGEPEDAVSGRPTDKK